MTDINSANERQDREKQILSAIDDALATLGGQPFSPSILATIKKAMNSPARVYHDFNHAAHMATLTDEERAALFVPLGRHSPSDGRKFCAEIRLAGISHDLAYTHVDGGVPSEFVDILQRYCTSSNLVEWTVRDAAAFKSQPHAELTRQIFGVEYGQALTVFPALQNEFLSALVIAQYLHDHACDLRSIAAVVTMIEATIPFRCQQDFDKLPLRLRNANANLKLELSENDIDRIMYGAVFLANKDVLGFAGGVATDPCQQLLEYLRGTWQLIPEFDPALRTAEVTPLQYLRTLHGNRSFVAAMRKPDKIDSIFHSYRGFPDENSMQDLRSRAARVLHAAEKYLETKMVTATICEGLAVKCGATTYRLGAASTSLPAWVAGVDDPINLIKQVFLGKAQSTATFAGDAEKMAAADVQFSLRTEATRSSDIVLRALSDRGDSPAYQFDVPRSPLGHFLHAAVDPKNIQVAADVVAKTLSTSLKDQTPDALQKNALSRLQAVTRVIGVMPVMGITAAIGAVHKNNPGRREKLGAIVERLIQQHRSENGQLDSRFIACCQQMVGCR